MQSSVQGKSLATGVRVIYSIDEVLIEGVVVVSLKSRVGCNSLVSVTGKDGLMGDKTFVPFSGEQENSAAIVMLKEIQTLVFLDTITVTDSLSIPTFIASAGSLPVRAQGQAHYVEGPVCDDLSFRLQDKATLSRA